MNYQKLDKREQSHNKTIYKNLCSVHARFGRMNFSLGRQNQEKEVHVANTWHISGPPCYKCKVLYETPTEIIALNILQNIEFKHSSY